MGKYCGQYGEGLAFYPGERSTPNMAYTRVNCETVETQCLWKYCVVAVNSSELCHSTTPVLGSVFLISMESYKVSFDVAGKTTRQKEQKKN